MTFRLLPRRCVPFALAAVLLAACTESPTSPPATSDRPSLATDAYCALYPDYCTPVGGDPSPSAPGYYAGAELTADHCSGAGGINDVDQDLLADDCELWLALKFAPEMIYDRADDIRRESYWAAKPIKPGLVRVFYALAYYLDLGTTFLNCRIQGLCTGHHGDSEHVVLDIRYDNATRHWVLSSGKLSAHTSFNTFSSSTAGYPTAVAYPDGRFGGFPRVWVSRQKHANYVSRTSCNNGGVGDNDDCQSNDQSFRPDVIYNRNLGSNVHRLIDVVASTNPFLQNPVRTESFWTAANFYGWQQDHTTHATGYGQLLRAQGF